MSKWNVPLKTTSLAVYTVEASNGTEAAVKAGALDAARKAGTLSEDDAENVVVRELSSRWLSATKEVSDS